MPGSICESHDVASSQEIKMILPFSYTLESAYYDNKDITNLLKEIDLQKGLLTVEEVIGSNFSPLKKFGAVWKFVSAPEPVYFTYHGCSEKQSSRPITKLDENGRTQIIAYRFEAIYDSKNDLFMHPGAIFTRFICHDTNGIYHSA